MLYTVVSTVDKLGHAVEIDQQAEEDLVGGRAVFVDAGEIAKDGDAGDILAMKGENTGRLRTQVGGAVGRRDVAMYVFVVGIVGGGNLGEEACDHLNDLGDGHRADLEVALLRAIARGVRSGQEFFAGQALDVRQALDADAAWRVCF